MTIDHRIAEIISDVFHDARDDDLPQGTIHPMHDLRDDLGLDSIDMLDVVMACEDRFGVTIADGEIERLTSVQSLVEIVLERSV
jgi:acyl carrier protein